MEYRFRAIEKKWQQQWREKGTYRVSNDTEKPKCYVLDMFPYPSGAGLHVGHPLGYIASDIYARYKRLKGFHVLHPMGYDAFGLPAELYALDTGQHPAVTTEQNIRRYREQLDNIGFCFDWSREVRTSDPSFYKWTQWIFLQLFNSWFNRERQQAERIPALVSLFEQEGNIRHECPGDSSLMFSAAAWQGYDTQKQQEILMHYRLAYCGYGEVNWCEALGTVLANDEVVNGVSERGGFPVVRKQLRQWYLRITEYADRLLEGLTRVDYSEAMKDMQANWIGRSEGAEIRFALDVPSAAGAAQPYLDVYTTRPDTLFGVDFMVLAPEHDLVDTITTREQRPDVEAYVNYVKSRSERERQAEKQISGCFTGAYALHPFSGKKIPVWISEYVLAGYGTGAIMAVPCGDERDHRFAQHFDIPVTNIIGEAYTGEAANPSKDAILQNSGFLDGMRMRDAAAAVVRRLEDTGQGRRKVNYKMRDAAFSRQRYWGEPFPITWDNGVAVPLDENALPLELPHVEKYRPGPEGEGPLANVESWTSRHLETNTMPGYAGSSWYFLRYMDPHNDQAFAARAATDYWNQVDVYVGGTEHAVGHLLYSRLWTKVLYDLGYLGFDEPYKKLINQGMIQGSSRLVYRVRDSNRFVSAGLKDGYLTDPLHVDVNLVEGMELNIEAFRQWRPEYRDASFILEDGRYLCGSEAEKMSKRYYNVVNPDDIVEKYGADTFRMYEMFLGPIEQSKPWDSKGIEGVHRFLKKLWRLFADEQKGWIVTAEPPSEDALRILHKTIRKVEEDTQRFSYNTAISQLMICVNELTALDSHSRAVLEPLLVLLTPYAPHICEELWQQLGHDTTVLDAAYPAAEEKYLAESTVKYPVAINGKTRTDMVFPADADAAAIESEVLQHEVVRKWMDGKAPKKVIIVKGRMINIVV
ncbi:leucine--tRNA ligase [Compostibacter hankyongensis]|uniref:Leucine--tRNA ligase n=1 Tax=Compostibacter hankyongensis TaxID=1007089 RepID=A0ABP8FGP0_9BACT